MLQMTVQRRIVLREPNLSLYRAGLPANQALQI